MTLTATVNPDFGQVEADPAVVNLRRSRRSSQNAVRSSSRGPECSASTWIAATASCTGLFYSRRIGRSPRGSPEAPEGGFVDVPQQTTILGAAKLTGKVGQVLRRGTERRHR